jgi:flagellar basal-body rod protein FlgB
MNFLQTPTLQILHSALNAATLRQRVIQNNLANVDTPGYKSQEVIFEDELKKALNEPSSGFVGKRTDPRHIPIGNSLQPSAFQPAVVVNNQSWVQNNGNNVDIEYEMMKMAENQIWYNALVQQTSGYFNKLREVIKEGR